MNHIKASIFWMPLLTVPITILTMNNDPYDLIKEREEFSKLIHNSDQEGDQLWDAGKMVAIASNQSLSKLFALHELIQNPDTHTTDTQELCTKVQSLLKSYPRYLTITNRNEQSAYDLLMLQMQRADLTTRARNNFEQLKIVLDTSRKQ